MSFLLFFGILLFGFFIFLFIWNFRKDERYLRQMADSIQTNKYELRELQQDIQSLHHKIEFINRICTTMKKEFVDLAPQSATDEAYEKVNQRLNSDITRLQEEVTSLKEKLSDDATRVLENLESL